MTNLYMESKMAGVLSVLNDRCQTKYGRFTVGPTMYSKINMEDVLCDSPCTAEATWLKCDNLQLLHTHYSCLDRALHAASTALSYTNGILSTSYLF